MSDNIIYENKDGHRIIAKNIVKYTVVYFNLNSDVGLEENAEDFIKFLNSNGFKRVKAI